jgi:hypothetical protein
MEFTLDKSDKHYGTDGEPTKIAVRQATQAQNEKRSRVFSEVSQVMDGRSPSSIELSQRWSMEELKRTEAFLTLVSCNIKGEDNKSLFKFSKDGGKQYLDMSDIEFREAWGSLPPIVANEIHSKVLEVNTTWSGPLVK